MGASNYIPHFRQCRRGAGEASSGYAAFSYQNVRELSNLPESTIYSGPQAASAKRVTLRTLQEKYAAREPLSMVTAYDYPSAVHVRPPPCSLPWFRF